MHAKVMEVPETDMEARRRRLKVLCDEKVRSWPNTLEATRMKKQNWKLEKEQMLEEKRLELDRENAGLQRQIRLETIAKANAALYEQTDKVKALRGSQLYSEVVETWAVQTKEQEVLKRREKDRTAAYHAVSQRLAVDAEEKETKVAAALAQKEKGIADMQMRQLKECQDAYVSRLMCEQADGKKLLDEAKAAEKKEQEEALQKKKEARAQMERMLAANEILQQNRTQQIEKDNEDLRKCAAERETMDGIAEARVSLEAKRFRERQSVRQAIIERATEQLLKCKQTSDRREEREAVEQRAKEDAAEEKKLEERRKSAASIAKALKEAREAKIVQQQIEREQQEKIKEFYKEREKSLIEIERAEEAEQRRRNMEVRATQELQSKEAKARKAKDKDAQTYQASRMEAVVEAERHRFEDLVGGEVKKLEVQGRSTYMLQRALATGTGTEKLSQGR